MAGGPSVPIVTAARSSPGHRRSVSASTIHAPPPVAAVQTAALQPGKTPLRRRNSLSAATSSSKDAAVLTGVFAMVDVRVGQDAQIDCSDVVAGKMVELGAVIVKRFTPRVTHIVLSQLTPVWKDKIAKWSSNVSMSLVRQRDGKGELQIVSQLWVNACYVSKTRMDEKPFFPVSKANVATGADAHFHMNGAMRQFVGMGSENSGTTVPATTTTMAAVAAMLRSTATTTPRPFSRSSSAIDVDASTSSNSSDSHSTNSTRTKSGSTSNRRQTLDGKGAIANPNAKKPANPANGAPALATRKSAIQFQFGAAAALAAATLSSNAVARKRRALSMEPMASDSIQKLLAADASASAATPQKEENESNGAKKKLEMDAISTPEAVGVRGRRSMSSAKRRKTISAIPHTPNPKTVPSVETSNTQKALFHDDAASECVADSQSEVDEAQSKQPSSATLQFSDDSIVPSSVTSSVSTNVVSDTVEAAAVRASSGSPNGTDNAALGAMTETVTNGNAGPTTKVADVPFDKSKPEATTNATDSAQVDIVDLTVLSSATSSGTSQIGKPDKVLKATSTPATSTPATSTPATTVVATKSVGAPAKAKAPAAPAIWACTKCGCTNARTRRLCKDCRTPKTAFDALRAETPEVAKKPAAPIPKVPSAATRASRTTTPAVPVAPKTPVVTAATTRRILTTPKTLTRPALSASRRQLTTPVTLSKSAARKLPLGAPKSPPRPLSALSDRHTQGSSQMSISSGSSVSVLEMTPVRVPERPGSKRSLYTSGSESGAKRQRLSEMKSSPSQRVIDLSNEQKVNLDRSLDRLATPRQSTSSRRSRSIGTSTPVKTPVKTPAAVKSARPTRSVIGITGVDMETRGVIECAVHAIDATMVTESGYRKARVVKSVDYAAAVTHLIVGEDTKRTIKVLFAIARGAWIVSEAWVFSSLEKEQWLPEEDFELDMFSNKYARMHPEERQIFKSMKFFVGSNVEPSREVLQSLLQSAGGEICNQISVADMVICGDGSLFRRAQRTGIRVVTAKWVFDSIGAMKLEDDVKYGLSTTSTSLEDD